MDGKAEAITSCLVAHMKGNGITQVMLAESLGITTNTLREKMRGNADWRWHEILKLSEITGMTPDEMCGIR